MEKVIEIAQIVVLVANKIAVIGITAFMVWALQSIMVDEEWVKIHPFIGAIWLRMGLSLLASGFAIDAFSVYVPAFSEVVMNCGLLFVAFAFRRIYRKSKYQNIKL